MKRIGLHFLSLFLCKNRLYLAKTELNFLHVKERDYWVTFV